MQEASQKRTPDDIGKLIEMKLSDQRVADLADARHRYRSIVHTAASAGDLDDGQLQRLSDAAAKLDYSDSRVRQDIAIVGTMNRVAALADELTTRRAAEQELRQEGADVREIAAAVAAVKEAEAATHRLSTLRAENNELI